VGIYVCGVTVYDDSHIGHARTVIVFDVLRRYLISNGYKVSFVQNFTDVDDKIINRAKAEGKKAEEISEKYIENYYRDFGGLNVLKADHQPKATDHIKEMIELIAGLIEKKHAYLTLNGVYFRVRSFSGYGKLSRKPVEELESGARIEVDPSKEDPLDFALWKFSSEDPAWESPWGKGRPGWHIECSAMSIKYLGSTFEIHGGGHDLVFPHHENEIAQSESYTGQEFAKIWMHSGMVTIDSQKMSKSLGNIVVIDKALKRWGMNSLRLYCISVHYSKPLDYTDELLQESVQRWRQIETCVYELRSAAGAGGDMEAADRMCDESAKAFEAAMDEDMNTALALTGLMKFVARINQLASADNLSRQMADRLLTALQKMMGVLGLRVVEADWAEKGEIEELIKERSRLREARKFKEADELRKKLLEERSVELMDHRGRTVWVKRERASE
jgi:cysteinyl-tRNA synthetase